MDKKEFWEDIYARKDYNEVSWSQEIPRTSLQLINSCHLPKDAAIIDIGGGESTLVDFLLREGYTDISVLDISGKALEKAKRRLGEKAKKVSWIEMDVLKFKPQKKYDLWHDRAAFHFLTTDEDIDTYMQMVKDNVEKYTVIGTFSKKVPKKCSGLDIRQYSQQGLARLFSPEFKRKECLTEDHITPFETIQNFLFCLFKKEKS